MSKKLTIEDIKQILHNRTKEDEFTTLKSFPQPDLFKDMDKATQRIVQAIKNNEKINLVGDYDVDGITSTAIMVTFFRQLNIDINYIIPNRFEHGYGLSPVILEKIDEGVIITVDNGISAYEAAEICSQKGLDLIITDHHTVGEKLPKAYAVVNPKQNDCTFPFKDICGAQVAWYLCASLKKQLNIPYNLMELFDYLALAIVADIMPMLSLNQTMVRYGLKALESSNKAAITALRDKYFLNDTITEEDIGFKFAPLINSAGRMSDPGIALEFLLSQSLDEANMHLDYLTSLNEARKEQQLQIFNEAKQQVKQNDEVILVAHESWNEGIIGIVASKLCEKYKKPAFVFTIKGDKAKASSRSTSNINLYNLIDRCSNLLEGYGGHKQAAGLSCKTQNLKKLKEELNRNLPHIKEDEEDRANCAIGEFCLDSVNAYTYGLIESFRPFGQENPYPVFLFRDMKVLNLTKMGKNKEFTKLIVSNNSTTVEVVVFVDFEGVELNDNITFSATIGKNEFRGNVTYNLMFKELL
jgi:single-stranded-DNA-specific exonuclease